jgi:hypothetical protein
MKKDTLKNLAQSALADTSLLSSYKRKLVFRIILLLFCFVLYFFYPPLESDILNFDFQNLSLVHIVWLVLLLEMLLVFFRRSKISMGSVKQFKRNYQKSSVEVSEEEVKAIKRRLNIGALKVLIVWLILNGAVALIYFINWIGIKELFILSALYYVGDLVCVIYFCPFQMWFMHNRCCVTCRIFNWDQPMMVTPLLFIPSWYSYTLGAAALFALIMWEYNFWKHSERFIELLNENLQCRNCKDKMCVYRKPLIKTPKKLKNIEESIHKSKYNKDAKQ